MKKTYEKPENYNFDMFGFMDHTCNLFWVYQRMEIQLSEFSKRNPEHEKIKETQGMIDVLFDLEVWLRHLEKDYRATQKVSFENNLANLTLSNKVAELEKQVIALNSQLQF